MLALGLPGGVDHNPNQFQEKVKALCSNLFQQFGWQGKIAVVGHGVTACLKLVAS